MYEDTLRHMGLRKILVGNIRKNFIDSAGKKGINFIVDDRVFEVMEKIPRHFFFDSAFEKFAYDDNAFPIGSGQTISQPFTVAFQTMLLNVKPNDRVLEIGTGSGYQTSILVELGAKVFTIERQKPLYLKAQVVLKKLGYRAQFFFGDGYKGLPAYAPFDRMLVTAGAPFIPEPLIGQLKVSGALVIPVGKGSEQVMTEVIKITDKDYKVNEHGRFSFVPMVED
ncbi:MAG: protein-L-isoaspartate(D-aspartate) O-methyltransferase [Bacteroidetes bacterium]|nr:protein-L-isoaspartate(D-aspartate) O-methyltransferase [Bacteroidota bacterium]